MKRAIVSPLTSPAFALTTALPEGRLRLTRRLPGIVSTSTSETPAFGASVIVTEPACTTIGPEHAPTGTTYGLFAAPETLKEKLPATLVPGAASLQTSTTPVGIRKLLKSTTVSAAIEPDGALTVALRFARSEETRRFSSTFVAGLKPYAVIAATPTPGAADSVIFTVPART